MLALRRIGPEVFLGHAHGAQRQRVHLIDHAAGHHDHLDGAAPDIHNRGRAPLEIEMAADALERELRLLVARNDLDLEPVPAPHLAHERPSIGRLSHRARRHRAELDDFEAVGDGLHLPERLEGALHRPVSQPTGAIQPPAQPGHFLLFVQHTVAAVRLHLRDHQAEGIGADVNGCESRIGRSHGCVVGA
ncbi:MAG: hypothetical protein A2W29_10845 [Gemmatimonadetes bacterium RBG_16_66_8]|nr:MAG: hypothetical protein A2W29_10845 [Gemmatimonadetes bacterium RBG_16_66_8]